WRPRRFVAGINPAANRPARPVCDRAGAARCAGRGDALRLACPACGPHPGNTMKQTLLTRLALTLAALAVHGAYAADQGPGTLLCSWNQQCTATGSCTEYKGSMHFQVDYTRQTVGIELGNGSFETVPAKITDKEISFSKYSQWTINRQTGAYR